MLFMIEKCIIGGICQKSHGYTKGNSKYMKAFD